VPAVTKLELVDPGGMLLPCLDQRRTGLIDDCTCSPLLNIGRYNREHSSTTARTLHWTTSSDTRLFAPSIFPWYCHCRTPRARSPARNPPRLHYASLRRAQPLQLFSACPLASTRSAHAFSV